MALWTPDLLPACFAWYGFDNLAGILTDAGGRITAVENRIAGGLKLGQTVAGSGPLLNSANGTAEFRGNADSTTTGQRLNYDGDAAGGATSANVRALFVVLPYVNPSVGSNDHAVMAHATASSPELLLLADTQELSFDGAGAQTGRGAVNGNALTASGEDVSIASGFTTTGVMIYAEYDAVQSLRKIGAGRSSGAYRLNGDMAELLLFSAPLAAADIDRLFGWAAHKRGHTASLPAAHPYKAAAPTTGGSVPAAPSGFALTAAGAFAADFAWSDNSADETGFEIVLSTAADFASGLISFGPAANASSYSASGLAAATTYYARIRARNVNGNSAWVALAGTTFTTLADPGLAPVVNAPSEDAEIHNPAAATISGTAPYVLRLAADDQGDVGGWINIVARVTVKAGTSVRIEADLASHQSGLHGPNCGWCFYDVTSTPVTWDRKAMWCANRVLTGETGIIAGDLPTAAGERTYLVALQPVWKEAFDADFMTVLRGRAHVHEPAYVASARSADPSLPANAYARVQPGARTQQNQVPTADAFLKCVRVTNTGVVPVIGKRLRIFVMGQHASEHQGNYACAEWLDWLTTVNASSSEEARRQRELERFDTYVFNANPLGRRYGKERWTEEQAGDEDPNRAWDDSGSAQINALRAAILAITGGSAALFMDFHGAQSIETATWPQAFMLYRYLVGTHLSEFRARMDAKLGTVTVASSMATDEFAQGWAVQTLGATVSETLEYALGGPGFFDASGEVRVGYAVPNGAAREVLDEMWDTGWFGTAAALPALSARHDHIASEPPLAAQALLAADGTSHPVLGGGAVLGAAGSAGMAAAAARYVLRPDRRTLRVGSI
jgi:hypothetical protein